MVDNNQPPPIKTDITINDSFVRSSCGERGSIGQNLSAIVAEGKHVFFADGSSGHLGVIEAMQYLKRPDIMNGIVNGFQMSGKTPAFILEGVPELQKFSDRYVVDREALPQLVDQAYKAVEARVGDHSKGEDTLKNIIKGMFETAKAYHQKGIPFHYIDNNSYSLSDLHQRLDEVGSLMPEWQARFEDSGRMDGERWVFFKEQAINLTTNHPDAAKINQLLRPYSRTDDIHWYRFVQEANLPEDVQLLGFFGETHLKHEKGGLDELFGGNEKVTTVTLYPDQAAAEYQQLERIFKDYPEIAEQERNPPDPPQYKVIMDADSILCNPEKELSSFNPSSVPRF